jgi:hypothetical protein
MIRLTEENANIEEIKISSLDTLAKIQEQMKFNQSQINMIDYYFRQSIKDKQDKRDMDVKVFEEQNIVLQDQYNSIFKEICDNAKFEEDRFLIAAKIKGDSYKEGRYRIIRRSIDKRTLNQAKFKKLYPKEFENIAKVELGKADNAIGKDKVTALCTIATNYTFEFYNPDEKKEE